MKKILAIIMMVCLLGTTGFADEGIISQEQKQGLYKYGIMVGDENGELRLKDTVTRAEAVKMICVAGGVSANNKDDMFPDVEKSHWAYSYIAAAKENGIVNGDENGNFNPEAEVTNEEFIKMAVELLGYGFMAETIGGFPTGYITTATRIGLCAGVQLGINAPAIRNDVGIIMYNALSIPIMVKTGEENEETYSILDGVTLKSKR